MNRLRRKFGAQQGPRKSNASEPGWNMMYNTGPRFDPSSDTLIADAQPQPPYPYVQQHTYSAPPSQALYYPQQPGMILVPMSALSTAAALVPHPTLEPGRPHLNPIHTAYVAEQPPYRANISTPLTPPPSSPPNNGHEEHRRAPSNPVTIHDSPASPVSTLGNQRSHSLRSPHVQATPVDKLLSISDIKSLQRYDLAFLISDSPSMIQDGKWQKCKELLVQLARVAMKYDSDGVEIHFLNTDSERSDDNFTKDEDVEAMFQSVASHEGSSRLSDKFDLLVSEYRGQLKRYMDSNPAKPWRPRSSPKKAIYIILTDGNHADTRKIIDIIGDMAGFLKTIQAPSTQFGIEFVQIGESSDLDWLHRAMYQDERIRRIVGVDTYNGEALDNISLGTMLLRSVSGENN
ncbi:hypothetical protein FRC07_015016 [Ceratobasidium sp. 392]|nr:hypothetical protein FRC07_015016 [Ceratobasidium sp. 392]